MPEYIRKRLGERLVEEGLITEDQFQTALRKHLETKVILRQILIDMGFITEEKLMDFMGKSLGISVLRDLYTEISDPQIVKCLPEKVCRQYAAIPLKKVDQVLTIAMADPFDVFAIDDLQQAAGCRIETAMARRDDISRVLDLYYREDDKIEEMVEDMAKEAEDLEVIGDDQLEVSAEQLSEEVDAPIIRLVNTIISQAIRQRASDIHIEPDEKSLRIRYRIDGILREAMVPPKRIQSAITSRIKIMASMDISIKRQPQDGRFKIRIENRDIDMRISTVPTIYGEKVVMRLLDQSSIHKGLGESGFSPEILREFRELIGRPYGIILVTGPTGSGKTTTLYLALQAINSPEKNIITIEEPVEYELLGINQIPVNVKANVTFAAGLRSILRQDPDVIMVGEIRDLETANIAVRAALTGHLVFSTLHTNDTASSIVRLIDMGIPPYLVTSSVAGVLAQRLVRVICPKCREAYEPAIAEVADAGLKAAGEKYTFYRGKGCSECGETGYQGRTAIFELMIVDKELRSLIHSGEPGDGIREVAEKRGMKFLWDDGMDKVLKGVTTLDEVKRITFLEQE